MSAELAALDQPRPCWLYRLYDDAETLLYVGISFDVQTRLGQHRGDKRWWPQVAEVHSVRYASQDEAMDAEVLAIAEGRPAHNDQVTRWRWREGMTRPQAYPLRMPDEVRADLKTWAEQDGRTLSSLINKLLRDAIAKRKAGE